MLNAKTVWNIQSGRYFVFQIDKLLSHFQPHFQLNVKSDDFMFLKRTTLFPL